mmetsp:Transcript_10232/g.25712  ORF Transcript_10232/g.25712 Transcript_10232/m.25712 type:complete len:207 (+) Transcript_10232:2052-2672(+)
MPASAIAHTASPSCALASVVCAPRRTSLERQLRVAALATVLRPSQQQRSSAATSPTAPRIAPPPRLRSALGCAHALVLVLGLVLVATHRHGCDVAPRRGLPATVSPSRVTSCLPDPPTLSCSVRTSSLLPVVIASRQRFSLPQEIFVTSKNSAIRKQQLHHRCVVVNRSMRMCARFAVTSSVFWSRPSVTPLKNLSWMVLSIGRSN